MSPKEQRQHDWEVRVSDFQSSGLKMTHWCSANQVNLEQMKYWSRKFKKVSTLVPIVASKSFIPLTTFEPAPQPNIRLLFELDLPVLNSSPASTRSCFAKLLNQ